ncbi:MAG: hypothetical protein GXY86_12365 [Firmicutes bacterium]|nr:hypothetical protein [Bacillota bacterium]
MFGLDNLFRSRAPSGQEVAGELHKILGDKPFEPPEWLNFDFESFLALTRDPVLIIMIIALLLGVYLLFKRLAPYLRYESSRSDHYSKAALKSSALASCNITKLFNLALDQAGTGEFGQAIILLHKATVEYITTKVITSSAGKKYSNNDFKRKLKPESDLYHPFILIARYAEIAGFSNITLSQWEFDKALDAFKTHFL